MASSTLEKGDFWKNLDIHLNLLQAENRGVRKGALISILKEVKELPHYYEMGKRSGGRGNNTKSGDSDDDSSSDDCGAGDEDGESGGTPRVKGAEELANRLNELQEIVKPIILRLSDPVEACRELSYEILTALFKCLHRSKLVPFLPQIIPTLLDRLGGVELIESSEEVRLIAVNFMMGILTSVDKGLAPFVDDWIRILSVTLCDPFHEVRIASCQLVSNSAKILAHVFHYNSERLNKPLVVSLGHQRSKVRLEMVKCIGDLLLFGNHKCVEDFIHPLTLRLFDSQPNVRKATVEVIGIWMLEFVDRYSYFHKLLPILMTALCDECDLVRDTAYKLWEKIGEKYLEENIQDYKDQVDFPTEMPLNYPDDVKRPNFGCRLLTQRNTSKIIPGITNDITDWNETTRQKCAQLLYHLILNCEDNITMHSEQVIQCIFKSCIDPNPIVSNYVLKSAQLLGYFVPFPISWSILAARLSSNPNENCLAATASVLEGSSRSVLKNHLREISSALASPDICYTLKSSRQFWILQACHGITRSQSFVEEEDTPGVENLFRMLLSVLAMTQDGDIKARAIVGLNDLKVSCNFQNLDDLFTSFCGGILQEIKVSESLWARVTPENLVFAAILTHGGSAVEKHLNVILEILVEQLNPKKEPEVRLNLFTLLSDVLTSYATLPSLEEGAYLQKFEVFVTTIVEDILSPNLVWRAGTSACALRASATSCLLTIMEQKLLSVDSYVKISPGVVAGCLGVLEENSELNRLLATQVLGRIGEACHEGLSPDLVHKVYPELLKRLDDEKDEVRVSAGLALSRLFANVPPDYNVLYFKSHLEFAANALLLHLDDDEENVQASVAEALKSLGALEPSLLIQKCLDFKSKHRSPDNCENLVEYFESLSCTSKVN